MTDTKARMLCDLLPCPFCGGVAGAYPDGNHLNGWMIGCYNTECHVEPTVWENTFAKAFDIWNRRAPTKEAAKIERLQKRVEELEVFERVMIEENREGLWWAG